MSRKYVSTLFVKGTEIWREARRIDEIGLMLDKAALGEIEVTQEQLRAAAIVLNKTIPDLKALEHIGKSGPKTAKDYTDAEIIALLERAGHRRAGTRNRDADRRAALTADVHGVYDSELDGGKDPPRH